MMVARTGLAALAIVAAFAFRAAADPVTIKFSTTMPAIDPVIKDGVLPFLASVEKASDGTVKFQSFTGGQLTPNPAKQLDAMSSGIDDVTIIVSTYIPQVFPDASIFALPDLVKSAEEAAYAGWKMYAAGLLRGMDRIHTLAIFANDPGSIFTSRKLNSLDELKGLKIRVSGPAQAQLVTALGGAPVGMSATEVAEALSRGIYDGTLNGWAVNRAYRAAPLIKTAFDLNLGVPQFFLAMNKTVYDKLPPAAREAIDTRSGAALSLELARDLGGEGLVDRADARQKGTFLAITPAEQQRLETIYRPLVDAWVADTPDGARKLAFLKAAVAEYRKTH